MITNRIASALIITGALASFSLSCGARERCAQGTAEQDGQCIPALEALCGPGTASVQGVCVPDAMACGQGARFDEGLGRCTADLDAVCATSTVGVDGECVPSEDICAPGARFDDDGLCVVDPVSCTGDTQLDARTGLCVASDEVCGKQTTFSRGRCVPVRTVCSLGTFFDPFTYVCAPPDCNIGDTVVNGRCTSRAEALLESPDLILTEDDDPSAGGTPNAVTLKPVDELLVLAGTVDASETQDVDVVTFEASRGDAIEIAAIPTKGVSLGFEVRAPDSTDWAPRLSPLDVSIASARAIIAPADGTYTVRVAPHVALNDPSYSGSIGDAAWTYALTLERLGPFGAQALPESQREVTRRLGEPVMLDLRAQTDGGVLHVRTEQLQPSVEGMVQVWSTERQLIREVPLPGAKQDLLVEVPEPRAFVHLDLVRSSAMNEVATLIVESNIEDLGPVAPRADAEATPEDFTPGRTKRFRVDVPDDLVVEMLQTSTAVDPTGAQQFPTGELVAELFDEQGDLVWSADRWRSESYRYVTSLKGGTYELELTNLSDTLILENQAVSIRALEPFVIGASSPPVSAEWLREASLDEGRSAFAVLEALGPITLAASVLFERDDTASLILHDEAGQEVFDSGLLRFKGGAEVGLASGRYVLELRAISELSEGALVTLDLERGSLDEVEPNDTAAQATPWATERAMRGELSSTDPDVFAFDVTRTVGEPNFLAVWLETSVNTNDPITCTLARISPAPATIATAQSSGDCALLETDLAQGRYALTLETARVAPITYTLALSARAAVLEQEPNDLVGELELTPLELYGILTGQDTDRTRVDLAAPLGPFDEWHILVDQIFPEGSGARLSATLSVEDDEGVTLASAAASEGAVILRGLTADTYTLSLERGAAIARDGRYRLRTRRVEAAALPGGDTCAQATAITASGLYTGSTSAASRDHDASAGVASSCTGFPTRGPDVVYAIDIGRAERLTATLRSDIDLAMYLVSGCTNIGRSCLVGADQDRGATFTERIVYDAPYTRDPVQRVYLVVDAAQPLNDGDFSLTIDLQR